MKNLLIPILCFLFFGSCSAPPLTEEEQVAYEELVQQEEAAKAAVASAGTPEEQAQAAAALKIAEQRLANFEAQVMRDRMGPFLGALSAIPVIGPFAVQFSPFLLGLAPLLSRRGRKHYGNAVKNLNPFSEGPSAGQGSVAPLAAFLDMLKAIGIGHSSDASKQAFESAS